MAKNPGFKRKKRYARRYANPHQSFNNIMDRYKDSPNPYTYQNPYANSDGNNNHHSHQSIREKIRQDFKHLTTQPIDYDLEQQILEFPGEQIAHNVGNHHGNEFPPPPTPAPKRRLYAAFRKDPKRDIKSDCVGRSMYQLESFEITVWFLYLTLKIINCEVNNDALDYEVN